MTFGSPLLLWALLLVPAAVVAYALAQRRRAQYAVRFTNLDLLANLVEAEPRWRRHVPPALYLVALSALLVAMARPQARVPVPQEQATVMLVMDVSGSMMAIDVQPSRLAAAKSAARSFIDQLPGKFRVGVVSFASTAQTLVWPTTDREAVRGALESLRAEGGTAMGDAIVHALDAIQTLSMADGAFPGSVSPAPFPGAGPQAPFPGSAPQMPLPGAGPPAPVPGTAPQRPGNSGGGGAPSPESIPSAILLLSDGANTTGRVHPLSAAEQARQLGIPVYTIALGTPAGVVEVVDPRTGLRQRQSVPPDERTLQRIADLTGGQFFSAPTANDLQAVYRAIGSRIGYVYEPREITAGFAGAAALLLLAGGALSLRWFNRFP